MKKLFTLLTMLLLGIGSMWADETYTIIDNAAGGVWTNGSYSNDNGTSTWKGSWTSTSTTPQITVSANAFLLQNSTGYIGSSSTKTGKYTIKINEGYLITGYEITFKNYNTDGSHNQTITPNGGSAVIAEGTGSATVTVTGLNTRAAYFKLTGENTLAIVTKFTITYKVDSDTWTSNVTGVGGSGNYYSNTWYIKLTTPNADDVFLDNFTLGIASDGSADTELETYLAFSQGKFSEQNNHKASEFLAISSNSISGHSTTTANIKEFNFDETVRLNGNTDVYVCFVSKNVDGTYNLQKRGLAVKNIGEASGLKICNGNNYTTSETSCGNYQCQYSCTYSISHDYPQTAPSNYYIWSGINDGDKTSGGKITVAYIKYTAPGTSGQFVHFDRFSLDFRTDAQDNPIDKYLLFSKERLTGTGVNTSTEFESSKFTAISTNKCTTTGVFMFAFDSDSYLEGGETYYIYMGDKLSNGKFTLVKYGLFINHQMDQRYISTGFQYSGALETQGPTTNNNWQPIYYSSKCTFADSKIALNIKEADETIRTRTIYANDDVDVKTALNIPSVFTVTPASITHSAGATSQDVNINASFVPSSAPATEANHRYFFKLHGKYAGGDDGKTLSASTDMSEKDQWTFGGNYYDGYTIYNVGQGKYLSVSNADDSQGTFVDEASAAKFIVATSGENLSFRLVETSNCYLNDRGNILSTWKDSRGATDEGSRITVEPIVTYNLKFGGSTIATKTVYKVTGDSEDLLPNEWERDFCTYSYEPAEIGNSTTSVDVTMTWDGPFDISADYENAVWYYLAVNGKWSKQVAFLAPNIYDDISEVKGLDVGEWAFYGNPYDGFLLSPKAKVNNMQIYLSSAEETPAFTLNTASTEKWVAKKISGSTFTLNCGDKYLVDNSTTMDFKTTALEGSEGTFSVRSYYCQQALDNWTTYVGESTDKLFGVTSSSASSMDGMIKSLSKMTKTEYDTNFATIPNVNIAGYISYNKPTTGYYRIKNNGTGNYLAYGTPTANGKTPSAGLIATSNNTDAASIIKLTGSSGTYKLSVQGLNIQSQTSANVAFPGSDAEGVDFVFNVSTPGVVSITNAASATDSNHDGSLHEGTDGWTVHGVVNWSASNPNSKWVVEDATGFDVAMNGPVDGNYYATLCVPFDVTIGNAAAYTLAKSESGNYLVPTEVDQVPAGTPVLLKGTNSTATATINTGSAFDSPLTCALTGTYVAKTIDGSNDYVFGKNKDGKVGFYHVNNNAFSLKANRAYLEATTDQARGFVLNFDDEATGIVAPTADTAGETTIYNLSGQRLNKVQKGINIVNGKKVLF